MAKLADIPVVTRPAEPSVAKLPQRMLTDVSLSFEEVDHLQTTLAVIQSRRYNTFVKKPWMDEDGNIIWNHWRTLAAKVIFSQVFETFMGMIIIFNLGVIVYEADQDARCYPEYSGEYAQCPYRAEALAWVSEINVSLLVIYSIESVFRFYVERSRFFCNPWNVTDVVIVILGWSSIALSTLNLSLLRLSRLVRVLRAARVFISVPEFYLLVSGLFSAMKAILLGSIILLSVICFWAVVAVETFHPVVSGLPFGDCTQCSMRFKSVTSASVTLFQQIVAGDSWGEISIPLLYAAPWTAPILFIIFVSVSLGVMNLILAVIVERAAEARENDHERKLKRKNMERNKTMVDFAKLCHDMDADGSGALSLEEMLRGYDENDAFRKIMDIMDIKREDMETIFHALDDDCSGEVSYIEFCQHLASFWERDPVMLQSLVKYSIMEIRKVLGREIMDTLSQHGKILQEQSQLLREHFHVPPPCAATPEWVPPDLHSFAALQDELRPLLEKASMLVIEALPLEIATAFEDDKARASPLAQEKAARWKEWTSSAEDGHGLGSEQRAGASDVSPSTDAFGKRIEEQFLSLCDAFEHRIREADSFQQRCRSLVDYLKVLKAEAASGQRACCLEVQV